MSSVARHIAKTNAWILFATLFVVGILTAGILHSRTQHALDEALLAAAIGRAHPDLDVEIEVDHVHSNIKTWIVSPDEKLHSEIIPRGQDHDGPSFFTLGDERVVLLPFEVDLPSANHQEDDRKHDMARMIAAATAPNLTVVRSVGPFLAIYGLFALLASAIATALQIRSIRRAFRPIEAARQQAQTVVGFGENQRLDENAPDEIQPLLGAINQLLNRLEDAHQTQSRFTAEAAHELRTPVTAMLGELDVALRNPRSETEYQRVLVSTREEVLRLRELVEGLTTLTRLDAGAVAHSRTRVRAGELATRALAIEHATLQHAGNQVSVHIEQDPEILAHQTLVETAIGNLLRNTARHAPGSHVELRVSTTSDSVVFCVDDDGPGIPEGDREAFFDRFVRSGSARERDRTGLGLGLAITREIARRHGGNCVLEASPSGGTRARFSIPRTSSETLSDI